MAVAPTGSAAAAVPACMTVQGKVLQGALEMRYHPQRGYCIVARSDIPAGAVLLQACYALTLPSGDTGLPSTCCDMLSPILPVWLGPDVTCSPIWLCSIEAGLRCTLLMKERVTGHPLSSKSRAV